MFAVICFACLIGICGLTVLATTVVLRLYLHAESKPLVAMPAWVGVPSCIKSVSTQVSITIL